MQSEGAFRARILDNAGLPRLPCCWWRVSLGWSEVVERERGAGDGAEGEGEEGAFGVVAGDAVGFDCGAGFAAVDDGPFAARVVGIASHFDGDGDHDTLAGAGAIARRVVDVSAVEAGGAVVAVLCSPGLAWDLELAVDAGEALRLVAALGAIGIGHGCDGPLARRSRLAMEIGFKCLARRGRSRGAQAEREDAGSCGIGVGERGDGLRQLRTSRRRIDGERRVVDRGLALLGSCGRTFGPCRSGLVLSLVPRRLM